MSQVDFNQLIEISSAISVSESYAHTGGAILVMGAWGRGAGKATATSVTFNSVAPDTVLVNNVTGANAEVCLYAAIWNNVAAVTANFAATFSGGSCNGSFRVFSISGHDTASPVQSSNSFTASGGTSYSNNLGTLAASSLTVDLIAVQGNKTASLAEDASQTELGSPYFPGSWVTTGSSYEVGTGTVSMSWSWTTSDNRNHILVAFNNAAASYSLSVDNGSAAGAGQASTFPVAMAVTSAQAVGEGQNSALLFDEAYVLSVSHAQATFEGQEVPFSIENQHTHAEAVFQGSDITMIADAVITVDAADATFAGQDIAMPFQYSLAVVAAQAAFERGFATMSATGSSSGAGHAIIGMRRRRL